MNEYSIHPYDWLIVGGGPHGVHIAASLKHASNSNRPKIGIIDPWPELLYRWNQCVDATQMDYLRSPAVHNLGIDPFGLQKFVGKRVRCKNVHFKQPYCRPSTKFFEKHSKHIIDTYKLQAAHIKTKVTKINLSENHAMVATSSGDRLKSKKLVLAIGPSLNLNIPDWATQSDNTIHIFSEDFSWPSVGNGRTLVLVGGGISAIQAALYAKKIGFKVHVISRHELRQHQFDSDPGWLGPKYMTGFLRQSSYDIRRKIIQKARHKGSAPQELMVAARKAIADNSIRFHKTEVSRAKPLANQVSLDLENGTQIVSDRVLLATGFQKQRPGGKLIDDLLAEHNLVTAKCGYPIVDSQLRWHPCLHVTGSLAELELGPVARNIAGARAAATRILRPN